MFQRTYKKHAENWPVISGLSLTKLKPLFSFRYFLLTFYNKNAEKSAFQEDHVAAIIDFVTIGLVVVLCLGYGQLGQRYINFTRNEIGPKSGQKDCRKF